MPSLVPAKPMVLNTLANLRSTLDVKTIVPGHAGMTDGTILGRYLRYASELTDTIRAAARERKPLDRVLEDTQLGTQYLPRTETPLAPFTQLLQGFHRLNLVKTYQEELARRA